MKNGSDYIGAKFEWECPKEFFSKAEKEWLDKNGAWCRALMHGDIEPSTDSQRVFLFAVFNLKKSEEPAHKTWIKYLNECASTLVSRIPLPKELAYDEDFHKTLSQFIRNAIALNKEKDLIDGLNKLFSGSRDDISKGHWAQETIRVSMGILKQIHPNSQANLMFIEFSKRHGFQSRVPKNFSYDNRRLSAAFKRAQNREELDDHDENRAENMDDMDAEDFERYFDPGTDITDPAD